MFRTKNLAFKDVLYYTDLHIESGSTTFITGKSGSGKSTLLKLLNKTANPSAGEMFYKGTPLSECESISLRKQVTLISQTLFLFPGTLRENFIQFYQYCEKPQPSENTMRDYLSLAEASFDLDVSCDTLSGGERQRVYLAICLSFNAETIMLDEPTSALDEDTAHKIMSNLVAYAKDAGKTLIIISHDHGLVERYADVALDISRGE